MKFSEKLGKYKNIKKYVMLTHRKIINRKFCKHTNITGIANRIVRAEVIQFLMEREWNLRTT